MELFGKIRVSQKGHNLFRGEQPGGHKSVFKAAVVKARREDDRKVVRAEIVDMDIVSMRQSRKAQAKSSQQ